VFYNPPVVNRPIGIRRSYLSETAPPSATEFTSGINRRSSSQCRLATELLLSISAMPASADRSPAIRFADTVAVTSPERREIEAHNCVKARSRGSGDERAELGIDIGSLDAVVMAGYPGSIRVGVSAQGRAGRLQTASLAVDGGRPALRWNQLWSSIAEYFFDRSPDACAHQNADNLEILISHLSARPSSGPFAMARSSGRRIQPSCGAFLSEDARAGCTHSAGCWIGLRTPIRRHTLACGPFRSDNCVVGDITGEHQ